MIYRFWDARADLTWLQDAPLNDATARDWARPGLPLVPRHGGQNLSAASAWAASPASGLWLAFRAAR